MGGVNRKPRDINATETPHASRTSRDAPAQETATRSTKRLNCGLQRSVQHCLHPCSSFGQAREKIKEVPIGTVPHFTICVAVAIFFGITTSATNIISRKRKKSKSFFQKPIFLPKLLPMDFGQGNPVFQTRSSPRRGAMSLNKWQPALFFN